MKIEDLRKVCYNVNSHLLSLHSLSSINYLLTLNYIPTDGLRKQKFKT